MPAWGQTTPERGEEVMEIHADGRLRHRRLMVIVVLAAVLSTLLVVPAHASGSFSWTFEGDCCITSRQWTTVTTDDIWIDIDSVSPCDVMSGSEPVVRIKLYRQGAIGWQGQGEKDIDGCSGDIVWQDMPNDTYRFYLEILFPHRDSKEYTINGNVAYDGAST